LRSFGIERRGLALGEALNNAGGSLGLRVHGCGRNCRRRGRRAGVDGLGIVIKQRILDDAPWVVLAGIVLLPVDLIDVDGDFFLVLLACARGHAADFLHQVGELLSVFGQTAGTDDEYADNQKEYELRAVDSKHATKITLSVVPVINQRDGAVSGGRGSSVRTTSRRLAELSC